MAGLLDIADIVETVTINGTRVDVPGISAEGIAHLFNRFPEIRAAVTGKSVSAERWAAMGVDAVAAIIAAGCGAPGDPAYEAKARKLPATAQADLLEAIMKVTMPDGIAPFVQRLTAMLGQDDVQSNMAPVTKLRKASRN
jgi:hypothetical protein